MSERDKGRRYDGMTPAERREERRSRLLDAGLELIGSKGYNNVSIRAVCDQAGTTERYFYESFSGKEALLEGVYERVVDEVASRTTAAVRERGRDPVEATRAGVEAFMRTLVDDPRKARVQLFEVVGVSEQMEQRRHEVMGFYARFIAETWLTFVPPGAEVLVDAEMQALGAVGAVNELLIHWMRTGAQVPLERVIDECTTLILAVSRAGLDDVRAWAQALGTRSAG